jgi:hypothetical protein
VVGGTGEGTPTGYQTPPAGGKRVSLDRPPNGGHNAGMSDDHDQRFKELIREFFPDLLRLFFPVWAGRFDLTAVEWLDKELMPEPPDGDRHILDLVARLPAVVPLNSAEPAPPPPWLALVHVEVESPDRTTALTPRLPGYYRHLRERYGLPVLPLVLYLKVGLDGIGVDEVNERFVDFVPSTFRYHYVGLPALDAADYLAGDNWLGVALSALMRIAPGRAVEHGEEALRRIGDAPVTDQQKYLLGECVEAYLPVSEVEAARFQAIIEANATGRVSAVNKTRTDRAKDAGIQEGRRAAMLELLEAQLDAQFGPLSAETLTALRAMPDDRLKQLAVAVPKAKSLADLGL